jgi:alcohol dehydrogenase (cytochrome c)
MNSDRPVTMNSDRPAKILTRWERRHPRLLGSVCVRGCVTLLIAAAGVLVAGCGGNGTAAASSGCTTVATRVTAPPAAGSGSWRYPNANLANTRDDSGSTISSANVSRLAPAWSFKLTGKAAAGVRPYGSLTASPIVQNGVVYIQDLDSNVYALALATGKLQWEYRCNQPERSGPGPNGVAVAGGKVYGLTPTAAFALSASTGRTIWVNSDLLRKGQGTFGVQPQAANGRVYVASQYGSGPGGGVLLALNASSGAVLWRFNTVVGPDPGVQSLGLGSGGAWETPLVSGDRSVTYGIGNPYQTPAGAIAHPARVLYTDSDVNLDTATGKLRWYYQGVPDDFKDYDMQTSPISAHVGGVSVVIGSGKMGYVYEMSARTGKLMWKVPVGAHNGHDNDSLQALEHRSTLKAPLTILPGSLGGVLADLAVANKQRVRGDLGSTADLHNVQSPHCDQGGRVSDR